MEKKDLFHTLPACIRAQTRSKAHKRNNQVIISIGNTFLLSARCLTPRVVVVKKKMPAPPQRVFLRYRTTHLVGVVSLQLGVFRRHLLQVCAQLLSHLLPDLHEAPGDSSRFDGLRVLHRLPGETQRIQHCETATIILPKSWQRAVADMQYI